ncbi:hypothetical protein NMG60_11035197 [Bertholletia excelsa]
MLQIRLRSVPSSEGGSGAKPAPVDTVTVTCPDHLVLADLPVAKCLGSATASSLVKTVGRRSRRQLGERVHFCVRCDFPIAIYGRLSPCDHAFCLDCARSDSICYLCDERIQKIQTIKMMEGIFICAAPHCLKSFLKKTEFESHIHETHSDLLQPNAEKEDGNESEAVSKQSAASESTARAPPRPVFSPHSSTQVHDREDKARHPQPRDQQPSRPIVQQNPPPPPFFGQLQDTQGGNQQEQPGQLVDKQQGILSETPFADYPSMAPNFVVPVNPNPVLAPPPFGYPPFPPEGAHPFYGAPYEMARPDSLSEVGAEQGSLLGFPPGPAMNFPDDFPRPWNMGQPVLSFESTGQGMVDSFTNMPDAQERAAFFQGEYGRNIAVLPPSMPPVQGSNAMDPRDGKGILAPQPVSFPPPPPPLPPHMSQHQGGDKSYSSDMGRDGRGFGWQHEKRDGFGSGQD